MLSLDAGVVESTEEGCPPAAAEPGVDEGKVAEGAAAVLYKNSQKKILKYRMKETNGYTLYTKQN